MTGPSLFCVPVRIRTNDKFVYHEDFVDDAVDALDENMQVELLKRAPNSTPGCSPL